jgi:hypothetical protein
MFCPRLNPETEEVGLAAFVNVPEPEITLHWPVPGKVALLAARVAETKLEEQNC